MLVKELIEKLKELDPTLRVVADGYEGGLNDIIGFETVQLKLFQNEEWYYGCHEHIYDEAETSDVSAYRIKVGYNKEEKEKWTNASD